MRKYFSNVNTHVIETHGQFMHLGFIMSWKYRPDGREKWCVEIATSGHTCIHIGKLTQNEARDMCRELADHIQTYTAFSNTVRSMSTIEEAMRK